jgi:Tfp pilus assembly protein PilF
VLGSLALWPALLALGLALAAALAFPERRRALCALAILAAALLPVLGLVPFGFQEKSTVADRYAYLALAGAALFAGLLVRRFGRPALGAALGIALLLGALSFTQAASWRDSRALCERVLEVNPRSTAAHDNLGFEALQQRDFEAARGHYLRALELAPGNALALSNLGACECELGHLDEGIEHLRKSIAASPRYVRARENLVAALGRKGLLEEAESAARELVALDPQNVQALLPLARVLRVRGKRVQAAELLERILAELPGWKPALAERAALAAR